MARLLPHRDLRRRELRIGESTDRDDDDVAEALALPVDRRAADRAEVEGHLAAALGDARPLRGLARDADLTGGKARLIADHRAGAALAREAMAHRHPRRLARDGEMELAAVAGGVAGGHRGSP